VMLVRSAFDSRVTRKLRKSSTLRFEPLGDSFTHGQTIFRAREDFFLDVAT
jgi:hypothetical protein